MKSVGIHVTGCVTIPFDLQLLFQDEATTTTYAGQLCMKKLVCLLRFQKHAESKIQSSTDKCVFRDRQSNVRWLLPASDNCRVSGNQIRRWAQSRQRNGARQQAETRRTRRTFDWRERKTHLSVALSIYFKVRMLLKVAVNAFQSRNRRNSQVGRP